MTSERIAILGPNGAGKSTLLSILTTSKWPSSGEFEVNGVSPGHRKSRRKFRQELGYVPQNLNMWHSLTCYEVLAYVAWLRCVPASRASPQIQSVLSDFNLWEKRNDRVKTLSGGMRQRLSLAQAMVNNPSLVVLDEPTVGLDPEQRQVALRYVRDMSVGRKAVFATHLAEDVANLATEVVVLQSGHLRFSGTLEEFCTVSVSTAITGPMVENAYLSRIKGSASSSTEDNL